MHLVDPVKPFGDGAIVVAWLPFYLSLVLFFSFFSLLDIDPTPSFAQIMPHEEEWTSLPTWSWMLRKRSLALPTTPQVSLLS
tara:strand:- start:7089 stop:7334 length:246 start_codon:yes stop_codon:yes gene_type:complete